MKFLILLIALTQATLLASCQSPKGLPTPKSNGFAQGGYLKLDSALIKSPRDTSWRPQYIGSEVTYPNSLVTYKWDGFKWVDPSSASSVSVTASNGLNAVSNNVKLGGTLLETTDILTNGNIFRVKDASNAYISSLSNAYAYPVTSYLHTGGTFSRLFSANSNVSANVSAQVLNNNDAQAQISVLKSGQSFGAPGLVMATADSSVSVGSNIIRFSIDTSLSTKAGIEIEQLPYVTNPSNMEVLYRNTVNKKLYRGAALSGGGGDITLTSGNGTTANGSAVNWGGILTQNVAIGGTFDGEYSANKIDFDNVLSYWIGSAKVLYDMPGGSRLQSTFLIDPYTISGFRSIILNNAGNIVSQQAFIETKVADDGLSTSLLLGIDNDASTSWSTILFDPNALQLKVANGANLKAVGLPTFADDASASSLPANTIYKTATGELRIKQ